MPASGPLGVVRAASKRHRGSCCGPDRRWDGRLEPPRGCVPGATWPEGIWHPGTGENRELPGCEGAAGPGALGLGPPACPAAPAAPPTAPASPDPQEVGANSSGGAHPRRTLSAAVSQAPSPRTASSVESVSPGVGGVCLRGQGLRAGGGLAGCKGSMSSTSRAITSHCTPPPAAQSRFLAPSKQAMPRKGWGHLGQGQGVACGQGGGSGGCGGGAPSPTELAPSSSCVQVPEVGGSGGDCLSCCLCCRLCPVPTGTLLPR